jgi:hypothetical protein
MCRGGDFVPVSAFARRSVFRSQRVARGVCRPTGLLSFWASSTGRCNRAKAQTGPGGRSLWPERMVIRAAISTLAKAGGFPTVRTIKSCRLEGVLAEPPAERPSHGCVGRPQTDSLAIPLPAFCSWNNEAELFAGTLVRQTRS